MGEREKEMERKEKEVKERRRDRIWDSMGCYIGKEERIV